MYQVFIRIMYEQDFRKYTIQEISEMKAILQEFKGEILEVKVKRIKEDKGAIHTLKKEN